MRTRRLGTTDLRLTPLGIGTYAIGGTSWQWSWGPQDDQESIAAIRAALDHGLNWIDTAAAYGRGHAEEIVAAAIKGRRDDVIIATKCGLVWDAASPLVYNRLSADSVRREAEESLRRLKVDVIDLYQIHWPNPDEQIEEAWGVIAELVREGKVRYAGVSNFSVEQMRRVQPIHPIASLQPPYSLVDRAIEDEILPFCAEQQIGVIAYSPMMSGLLSGAMTRERIAAMPDNDWRRDHPEFQEPRLARNLALVELLRGIGSDHGCSPGEVAIAWTLRHQAVTAAIVGVRRPEQISGVIGAATLELSDSEAAAIEAFLTADA